MADDSWLREQMIHESSTFFSNKAPNFFYEGFAPRDIKK
jgi:hypothetical protein